MNTLEEKLQADLVSAMKEKDANRISAIRSIKTGIQNEKVNGTYHELTDNDIVSIIQKLSKQRQESADIYASANRNELAEKELAEKAFLDAYLPKMLTEDELTETIKSIVEEAGVTEIRKMGLVMKTLKERYPNQFDGGVASRIIKGLLSN